MATSRLSDEILRSDAFRMYSCKISMCTKRWQHDWQLCPYAHNGERAARRSPHTHTGIVCPAVKQQGRCSLGDACPFAHNVFEYWLHPTRYRTQLCNDGGRCRRAVCFFAHSLEELRSPDCKPFVQPEELMAAAARAAATSGSGAAGVQQCCLPPAGCSPPYQRPLLDIMQALQAARAQHPQQDPGCELHWHSMPPPPLPPQQQKQQQQQQALVQPQALAEATAHPALAAALQELSGLRLKGHLSSPGLLFGPTSSPPGGPFQRPQPLPRACSSCPGTSAIQPAAPANGGGVSLSHTEIRNPSAAPQLDAHLLDRRAAMQQAVGTSAGGQLAAPGGKLAASSGEASCSSWTTDSTRSSLDEGLTLPDEGDLYEAPAWIPPWQANLAV